MEITQECFVKMNGGVAATACKMMVCRAIYGFIVYLFAQMIFVDEVQFLE